MSTAAGTYSQVCYVVNDIEDAILGWTKATGAGPWLVFQPRWEEKTYRGDEGLDEYKVAFGFMGSTFLEFYQPLDGHPSILREILDSRGEGFHHVCPEVRPMQRRNSTRRAAATKTKGWRRR